MLALCGAGLCVATMENTGCGLPLPSQADQAAVASASDHNLSRLRSTQTDHLSYLGGATKSPILTTPTGLRSATLSSNSFSMTPAIINTTWTHNNGQPRLIAVDDSSNYYSYSLDSGSASLCNTTELANTFQPQQGTSLATDADGRTFYYIASTGHLIKGVESLDCDNTSTLSDEGQMATVMNIAMMNLPKIGPNTTPWVYEGYVYLVDTGGHIFYYPDEQGAPSDVRSLGTGVTVQRSTPIVFANRLWVGDDSGKLYDMALTNHVPGQPNILNLSQSLTCSNGFVVSAPSILADSQNPRLVVTVGCALVSVSLGRQLLGSIYDQADQDASSPAVAMLDTSSYQVYYTTYNSDRLHRAVLTSGAENELSWPASEAHILLTHGSANPTMLPLVNPFYSPNTVYLLAGDYFYSETIYFSSGYQGVVGLNATPNGSIVTDQNRVYFSTSGGLESRGLAGVGDGCSTGDLCASNLCTGVNGHCAAAGTN